MAKRQFDNVSDYNIIQIMSGTWASGEEIAEQVIEGLKEKGVYQPNLVYRVIPTERPIAKKLYKTGAYRKSEDLEPNEFWGDTEEGLPEHIDYTGKDTKYLMVSVYLSEKVTDVGGTVFQFNEPQNRQGALKALAEVRLEDVV